MNTKQFRYLVTIKDKGSISEAAKALYMEQSALSHDILCLGIDAKQDKGGNQTGMIESPADKRPVGTMPQATDKEHDQCVADHLPTGTAASS